MTSIFVAKLDFGVTNEQLRQLFEQHGSVIKVNVATDRETGKSRGFAFVEMANRDEAMNAINALNGHMINGRDIAVKEAEQRGDSRPNNHQRPNNDSPRPFTPRNDDRRPSPAGSDAPAIPPVDSLKSEPRKKVNKDRKPGDSDSDNRNKKPKMDAYKKSGKVNRFFDEDEDDFDEDLFSYKKREDEDDFDDEDDEDFA
ncbi:MAG: RNA recognition motif domain-containing protein [Flavobacteriales bacterium]